MTRQEPTVLAIDTTPSASEYGDSEPTSSSPLTDKYNTLSREINSLKAILNHVSDDSRKTFSQIHEDRGYMKSTLRGEICHTQETLHDRMDRLDSQVSDDIRELRIDVDHASKQLEGMIEFREDFDKHVISTQQDRTTQGETIEELQKRLLDVEDKCETFKREMQELFTKQSAVEEESRNHREYIEKQWSSTYNCRLSEMYEDLRTEFNKALASQRTAIQDLHLRQRADQSITTQQIQHLFELSDLRTDHHREDMNFPHDRYDAYRNSVSGRPDRLGGKSNVDHGPIGLGRTQSGGPATVTVR